MASACTIAIIWLVVTLATPRLAVIVIIADGIAGMWQWGLIGGSVVAPAVPPAQLSDGFGGPGIASEAKR